MDYKHIYTDGSKDNMKVGYTVVLYDFSETLRISDGSSIFIVEAKAIDLALYLIADCETFNKFVIFQTPFQFFVELLFIKSYSIWINVMWQIYGHYRLKHNIILSF